MMRLRAILGVLLLSGCASTPGHEDVPSHGEITGAPELYASYAAALRAHRRDTLASFYHPDGATIVLNGVRRMPTNAGIDSTYRGAGWQGPAFFAFDSLRFEPIAPRSVLVTGGFRWLPAQSSDTLRYVYLAILDRTPDGLRIRVEHETERPISRR
jgi:ketosteroid isomerase-like protein